VDYLAARGCLQSGTRWASQQDILQGASDTTDGTDHSTEHGTEHGTGAIPINLWADEAGRLHVSWQEERCVAEVPNGANHSVEAVAGERDREQGREQDGKQEGRARGDVTEIVVPIELVRHPDGSSRFYFNCPGHRSSHKSNAGTGVSCGRRVAKLYFLRGLFLCRQCHGLIYSGPYESPGQRALRRANKLWQRLNSAVTAEAAGAEAMPEPAYARLIEEVLQAETQATEACTARLQRLVAWLDKRSRRNEPQFTLE
jgi:hypothetical protein